MKRRVFAVIIMMTLLTSMTLTATAESTAPETDLNTLGLLLNISKEEMAATLSREVGITMILKAIGFTQSDADLAASNSAFTDVPGWSKGWAELAYVRGLTTGIGDGRFDPKAPMTQKQFLTFILRALEYDQSAAWENVAELSVAAGLTEQLIPTETQPPAYTKKEASKVMYNALSAELQGKKVKLIDDLIERKVVAADAAKTVGLIETIPETDVPAAVPAAVPSAPSPAPSTPPAPVTPTPPAPNPTQPVPTPPTPGSSFILDKASAFGLKAMKVTFTSAVDTFTVKSISGATMAQSDGQDVSVIDNKEVVLIFKDPVAQNTDVTLTFDAKGKDGVLMTGQSVGVRLFDNEAPKIIRATAPNPFEVVVQYSEPIDYFVGSKTFDGVEFNFKNTILKSELSKDLTTLTFTLKDRLPHHSNFITIHDAKDFASIPAQPLRTYLRQALSGVRYSPEATTLPAITIKVNSTGDVLVTFPKPVTNLTPYTAYVQDYTNDQELFTKEIRLVDATTNTYLIDVTENLVSENRYSLIITHRIKDPADNQVSWYTYPHRIIVPDRRSPEVFYKPALIDSSSGTVRIAFNEPMDKSTLKNLDNYLVKTTKDAGAVPFSSLAGARLSVDLNGNFVDLISKDFNLGGSIETQNLTDDNGNILTYSNSGDATTISTPMPFTLENLKFSLKSFGRIEVISSSNAISSFPQSFRHLAILEGDAKTPTNLSISAAYADEPSPYKLSLFFNEKPRTDATTDGATKIRLAAGNGFVRDVFGTPLTGNPQILLDEAPPRATIENIKSNSADLLFSEPLANSLTDTSLLKIIDFYQRPHNGGDYNEFPLIPDVNVTVIKGDDDTPTKVTIYNLQPNTSYLIISSTYKWSLHRIKDASPYQNIMDTLILDFVTKSTTP